MTYFPYSATPNYWVVDAAGADYIAHLIYAVIP